MQLTVIKINWLLVLGLTVGILLASVDVVKGKSKSGRGKHGCKSVDGRGSVPKGEILGRNYDCFTRGEFCGRYLHKPLDGETGNFVCSHKELAKKPSRKSRGNRLSAGLPVPASAFPAHVVVKTTYGSSGSSSCSGVLVDRNIVLTAAHCFNHEEIREVRLLMGMNNSGMAAQTRFAVLSTISKAPEASQGRTNDYAVVYFEPAIETFAKSMIEPACLPQGRSLNSKGRFFSPGFHRFANDSDSKGEPLVALPLLPSELPSTPGTTGYVPADAEHMGSTCPGDSGTGVYGLDTCSSPAKQYVLGTLVGSIGSSASRCKPGKQLHEIFADTTQNTAILVDLMDRAVGLRKRSSESEELPDPPGDYPDPPPEYDYR